MTTADWAALIVGIAGVVATLAGLAAHPVRKSLVIVAVTCLALAVGIALAGNPRSSQTASRPPNSPVASEPNTPSLTTPTEEPPTAPSIETETPQPQPTPTQPSPAYLTDLEVTSGGAFQGGVGDNIQLGVVSISGKSYEHSFRESICINTPIAVALPSAGYSKLTGTAGFSDESSFKGDVTVQIELAANSDGPWTRVLLQKLSTQHGIPFSVDIPPDALFVRLSATQYACSTTIAWGNPQAS